MTETAEAKPQKLIPISQPISVLPTDIARLYTHIHPILILTVYFFCFPYLVADPVSVLSKAIAPLAHLQITYCVVCLPQSSGTSTPPPSSSKSPAARKRVQFAQSTKSKPTSVGSRITVPIPLDWDREWQKWPVTIVTGAYLGWFVFRFAGEYLLRGKRIEFD
ncbi:Glycosylphosphatidylinositol (GPI) anchor assembly protein [Imshaugia aleurites]|uniref:Glycosylphosphatidylinositol (GPI) anchor assembly protein n=1 Tax=Imshaugia aleurites TaxID=172621 RepID=A0A8H3IBW0_9LECA|nr:Glycosylphosphatidylinositol (GPI) anchor assembly protein [Imshaugia aleurites]